MVVLGAVCVLDFESPLYVVTELCTRPQVSTRQRSRSEEIEADRCESGYELDLA
jgi:hypothetical protein